MSAQTRLINTPELNIAFFSFVLHFVWEFLQVPTYAGMSTLNHWDGILICTQATVGDVGFALTAFWTTALFSRSRWWVLTPSKPQIVVFLAVGITLTIGFEYFYTEVTYRWTYANLMPRVPPFGTGLSPLVQWTIVPSLVLFIVRRQIR